MNKATLTIVAILSACSMTVAAYAMETETGKTASAGSDTVQAVATLQRALSAHAAAVPGAKDPGRGDGVYDDATDQARVQWQAWRNEQCEAGTGRGFACTGLTLSDLGLAESEIRSIQKAFEGR